ncbi:uncharacterized protein METZ01_LOCUS67822, partial [marine metagenome]
VNILKRVAGDSIMSPAFFRQIVMQWTKMSKTLYYWLRNR